MSGEVDEFYYHLQFLEINLWRHAAADCHELEEAYNASYISRKLCSRKNCILYQNDLFIDDVHSDLIFFLLEFESFWGSNEG